jgi:hypothetical protein
MIVDVENGDVPAGGGSGFGRDGGVVEVAIAAEIIRPAMVPGRTAQRERGAVAGEHGLIGGERGLRAPIGAVPGAGADRRCGVVAVATELRIDAGEVQRAAAHDRPGIAGCVTRAAGRFPLLMGGLQESEIIGGVDAQQRRLAEILGRLGGSDRVEDGAGAAGCSAWGIHAPLCSSCAGAWASWVGWKKRRMGGG